MRTIGSVADRLVKMFVPQVTASAAGGCWNEYDYKPCDGGLRQRKRSCCIQGTDLDTVTCGAYGSWSGCYQS